MPGRVRCPRPVVRDRVLSFRRRHARQSPESPGRPGRPHRPHHRSRRHRRHHQSQRHRCPLPRLYHHRDQRLRHHRHRKCLRRHLLRHRRRRYPRPQWHHRQSTPATWSHRSPHRSSDLPTSRPSHQNEHRRPPASSRPPSRRPSPPAGCGPATSSAGSAGKATHRCASSAAGAVVRCWKRNTSGHRGGTG